jgi:hypothetical protein
LIPTPIRQVLSTMQANGVQALLMGGQACVFYGAAQVSKDIKVLKSQLPQGVGDGEARGPDGRQQAADQTDEGRPDDSLH